MTQTFVPGYLTTITVDGSDISVSGRATGIQQSRNVLNKPLFGRRQMGKLAGQADGSFTVDGHVTVEDYGALEAIWEAEGALAFSIQIGTAAGATDVGVLSGFCVVTGRDLNADADSEWDWSMNFDIDGDTTWTAGTPVAQAAPAPAASSTGGD